MSRRIERLRDALADEGFVVDGARPWHEPMLEELDYALHPTRHERRVPSVGAIVGPTTDPDTWEARTDLEMHHWTTRHASPAPARLYADGLSSFLVRTLGEQPDEFVVFDRPAGSERDLVVLAETMGATIVQRHPAGMVRVVGEFGVLRWDGIGWHHEPPIGAWIDSFQVCAVHGNREVLTELLEFAVHDLGARGIGATLIYRPVEEPSGVMELRMPEPPKLRIGRPVDLAPLRHVLAQVDGAAVFDVNGVLEALGVRLVATSAAVADVDGFRGMRHTSGLRYSFDEPTATVIVVSEEGPVTVLRDGTKLGSSAAQWGGWSDLD